MNKILVSVLAICLLLVSGVVQADERATPEEVLEMVLQAAEVVQVMGDAALPAFNDPKGEFVWKDTFVFVVNCDKEIIAAHPSAKVVGLASSLIKDAKDGRPILKEGCQKMNPGGFWMVYHYPAGPGKTEVVRKVLFALPVEGTTYQVASAIISEKATVEELNKLIK